MIASKDAGIGSYWAVKVDVGDLGAHLDVTLRAVAGTLGDRVKDAASQVTPVGAFSKGS